MSSRNKGTSENIAVARTFARRRPLQLHLGHFRVFGGPRDDTAFGLSILENTINLVFMVDTQSKVYLIGGKGHV